MTIDPDKAIEKLTEYRKESEQKKKIKKEQKLKLHPIEIKLRNFLIKFYRFNAVVYITLGILMTVGNQYTNTPLFLDFLIATIAFIFPLQIFSSISRLDKTRGRKTTIDDVFATALLMPTSLFFLFFTNKLFAPIFFWITYAIVAILWILQIVYVNYRKPSIEHVEKKKSEQKKEVPLTRLQILVSFITLERIIIVVVGILFAAAFLLLLSFS